MPHKKKQPERTMIPPETQQHAKTLIQGIFSLFSDQSQRLADEFAAFETKRQEVRERISRGARRTSGRIV